MSSVISVLKLRLLKNVLSPNPDELGTSKYPTEGVLSIDSAGGGFVKAKIREACDAMLLDIAYRSSESKSLI